MPKPPAPKTDPDRAASPQGEELARPTKDPDLKAAAIDVTAKSGETGSPLSWRIQPDGTLTVILPSGKKINRPLPKGYKPAAVTIKLSDGIDDKEATLAGKALQKRKKANK
jgi:hypothetical protein